METEEFIQRLEIQERRARKRAIILTLVPVITAIILIIVTSKEVITAKNDLRLIKKELDTTIKLNQTLKLQNDSLSDFLIKSTITLGKTSSVLWSFKEFIDRMPSANRSADEAKFFIEFRMLEERVRDDYKFLSREVSKLPTIEDENDWIVIVESSVSFDDLMREVRNLEKIYGREQIAIYKEGQRYFRLAVKGNGSFTRAYRLNVQLRNQHGYMGAYFAGEKNWGKNYLAD